MLALELLAVLQLCRSNDCDGNCAGTAFLQQHHQLMLQRSLNVSQNVSQASGLLDRILFLTEPWDEAQCARAPWMCAAPFDCLNTTGQVETLQELKQHLAKPSGVNLQSWCHANPTQWQPGFECIIKQDLQGYAALMRQSSIEYHYEIYDASYCFMSGHCENDQVTLNTTVQEAEQLCDERFPEPQGWRSVGLQFPMPSPPFWTMADVKQIELLACATASYHCDVIYCRQTYCQMEEYKKIFATN
ncbi:unnamed protein product [Cladocopium goreaui]|uniref:LINE-1 reverse transcriptase-like n=1 Tax=Cladocopium goreaui TaxID=2562237 RepID=A0A9P1FGZ5_9DINO|nr:unnamed protein product [Cladocopium goreaui]